MQFRKRQLLVKKHVKVGKLLIHFKKGDHKTTKK